MRWAGIAWRMELPFTKLAKTSGGTGLYGTDRLSLMFLLDIQ